MTLLDFARRFGGSLAYREEVFGLRRLAYALTENTKAWAPNNNDPWIGRLTRGMVDGTLSEDEIISQFALMEHGPCS